MCRHIKETRRNTITSSKPFFPISSFRVISLPSISSSPSILSSSGLIIPRGQQHLNAEKKKVPHNRVESTSSQLSERHTLKEVKSVSSAPHGMDSLDLISHVSHPFTLTWREVWLIVIIWGLLSCRSAVARKCANLFVCIWKMCPALTDGFGSPLQAHGLQWNLLCDSQRAASRNRPRNTSTRVQYRKRTVPTHASSTVKCTHTGLIIQPVSAY